MWALGDDVLVVFFNENKAWMPFQVLLCNCPLQGFSKRKTSSKVTGIAWWEHGHNGSAKISPVRPACTTSK